MEEKMLKKLSTALTAAALYATTALGCGSTMQFKVPEMPTTPEKTREFVMGNLEFDEPYIVQHGERMYGIMKKNLDGDNIPDLIFFVGQYGKTNGLSLRTTEIIYFDSSFLRGPGTVDEIRYYDKDLKKTIQVSDPQLKEREAAGYVISEVMKTAAEQMRWLVEVNQYAENRKDDYQLDKASQDKRDLENLLKKTQVDPSTSQIL